MRKGFSKLGFMLDEEREHILKLIDKGWSDEEIAAKVYWPVEEVRDTRCEFFPTAGLAKYYIKSQALNLARRIVADANVEEAVDILSRPNIGVLAPAVKNNPGPMKLGVMTSINPADLGGVRVMAQVSTGEAVPVPPPQIGNGDGPPCLTLAEGEMSEGGTEQDEPAIPHSIRSRTAPLIRSQFPQSEPDPEPDPEPEGVPPCPSPQTPATASKRTRAAAKSASRSTATRSSKPKSSKRSGKTPI